MIRMIQSASAGHAKAYFSDALLKSDYYINDQELQGQFRGKLAERLSLDKMASKEEFFSLCENKHPKTGQPLTPRNKDNRTIGYDINFHCPKSVSILHVLSRDPHILRAFQKSVSDTMTDIEQDSATRVRKSGQHTDRQTQELVWAEFVHQTARPVDDELPDPHLHSHCFVFNATWDNEEKQYKAAQFQDIKRDMPYYQARFHKRLSDHLINLGYRVRLTDKSFEIDGVPQKAIDLFSKRTDEIGRFAKEKGIADAKQLDALGARTRSKKQKGFTMDELKTQWKQQMREIKLDNLEDNLKAVRFSKEIDKGKLTAEHCINYAVKHSFERFSVMRERRLLETAYKHALGNTTVGLDDISNQFLNDDRIIHIKEGRQKVCTTKEVFLEEKKMVQLALAGRGKMQPFYENPPELSLHADQNAAIQHLLTTKNQVSIIRGAAGTGKTTLMTTAVKLMEDKGKKVTVIAPTAQASHGVLKNEGFENAETVAKFLIDKQLKEQTKNQVIWVDEAGLLGTQDMVALLEVATKYNARLILGGDTRQHASVIRGDALRILNTVGGIKSAEVSKIFRQKDFHYKSVVEHLSQGDIKSGFEKLDRMEAIKTIDALKPNNQLVSDYLQTIKRGKSALIVSPTHQQGEDVTDTVRIKMRQAGLLGKKEINALKLTNVNFTEAEKSDWRNYRSKDLIQFNQNIKGFMRGSLWTVENIEDNLIKIKDEKGKSSHLPLKTSKYYDVFKQEEIGLSKGDQLVITRNGFDEEKKRLNNGMMLEVASVSKKGQIKLVNRKAKTSYILKGNFGHLRHAYCITSHASQGKTVDEVFIAQPSGTFAATNAKQFYVSVSRGREAVHIYTDDKEALLDYASAIGDRQSALELVTKNATHEKMVEQGLRKDHGMVQPSPEKTPDIKHPKPFKEIDKDYEFRL